MDQYKEYSFLKKKLSDTSIQGYPLDRVLGSYIARVVWGTKFEK